MLSKQEKLEKRREQKRISGLRWYLNNREKHREQQRDWRAKNRESERERKRKWAEENSERKKTGDREYKLRKKYGITLLEFEQMLAEQKYCCAVCGTDDPGSKFGWHVDHDHITGKVRGILCAHCNHMLGHAKDDIETLSAGISYLQKKGGQ